MPALCNSRPINYQQRLLSIIDEYSHLIEKEEISNKQGVERDSREKETNKTGLATSIYLTYTMVILLTYFCFS